MISKTEMLDGMDKVSHEITAVLHSWSKNEGNNLEGFINNPIGHVNYNPYVILDFTKLSERLKMLRKVESDLNVITEHKKGNPDVTRSMYETAIEGVHIQLLERLLDWLQKRYADMSQFIATSGNASGTAPIDDYQGMFSFNIEKFTKEYTMYESAISGCKVVVDYKKEQIGDTVEVDTLITSNEPPISGNSGA